MIGWSCSRFSQRLNLPGRPGRTARESAPACLRLSRLFPRPARRQWRVRWPCSGTRQRRPCRLRKTLRRWLFQCFAGKVRKCWRLKHNPRRAPSGVGQPGVWGNQGRFLSCLKTFLSCQVAIILPPPPKISADCAPEYNRLEARTVQVTEFPHMQHTALTDRIHSLELLFSLKHFGHLSHSFIKTFRNSIQWSIIPDNLTELT